MKTFAALIDLELKGIRRDSTMLILSFVPILLLLIFRFAFPPVFAFFGISPWLTANGAFIASVLLLFAPTMMGMASGYLLLDDRDEDLLSYLDVTPLRKSGYIGFKALFPLAVSAFYVILDLLASGYVSLPLWRAVPVVLIAVLNAPIVMFLMAAFAGNKVEGLAVGKALNMLNGGPFGVVFLPAPWSWIVAILPTSWITRMMLATTAGEFWAMTAGALVVHLLWLAGTWALFKRRVG